MVPALPALRRSPRALLAWVAAALTALLTARMVAADLADLHARARSAGPAVRVVVAGRDLPLGATVERGDVAVRRSFARLVPPGALRSVDGAVGRVVATPVLRGSALTARHLVPAQRRGLAGVVPRGMRAVRVAVGDGLRPPPGSVVDVIVTLDQDLVGPDVEPTLTVVRGALVVGGDDRPGADDGRGAGGVTLLTDPDGARRLAFAAAEGTVTLALAPPEEACCRP